ncbi:hypothetical protein BDQ17DRAFT_814982 [Cyathus striatus]|nr:hypothetical protein BDQ17DRAFT_814982 [Cyathus striatus]
MIIDSVPDKSYIPVMQSYSTEPEPCPSLVAHPWRNKNLVIFVVDIVHPGYFRSASRRELAHVRMKEILKKHVLRCNLPELYTIYAFGTQVAFYKYDTGRRKMQPGDAPPPLRGAHRRH